MQLKLEEGAHLPGRADENLTSIVRRNTTATGVTKVCYNFLIYFVDHLYFLIIAY